MAPPEQMRFMKLRTVIDLRKATEKSFLPMGLHLGDSRGLGSSPELGQSDLIQPRLPCRDRPFGGEEEAGRSDGRENIPCGLRKPALRELSHKGGTQSTCCWLGATRHCRGLAGSLVPGPLQQSLRAILRTEPEDTATPASAYLSSQAPDLA